MPDTTVQIIGKELAPVRDVHGFRLAPDVRIVEAGIFDVLLVPGGHGQQALMHRAQAGVAKPPKVRISSYRDFAKFVSTTPKALDPKHSNIVIHTDGTIAAVYFDFVFKIDGKAENHGTETWQPVKAADGWRIAAISILIELRRTSVDHTDDDLSSGSARREYCELSVSLHS